MARDVSDWLSTLFMNEALTTKRRLSAAAGGLATLPFLLLAACAEPDDGFTEGVKYGRTLSPDGEVSAFVYHYDSPTGGLTQVGLDFLALGFGCGMGSAAWHEYDMGVELRWVSAEILEVRYPDGNPYRHNASGDFLGCMDRPVRVVMVPRGSALTGDGAYSEPVESDHTLSPDLMNKASTIRYDSPSGGVTQVVVNFGKTRGCEDSAVTFYDHTVELAFEWTGERTLEVRYPEGEAFDLPPWGSTIRCVTDTVEVTLRPIRVGRTLSLLTEHTVLSPGA